MIFYITIFICNMDYSEMIGYVYHYNYRIAIRMCVGTIVYNYIKVADAYVILVGFIICGTNHWETTLSKKSIVLNWEPKLT